MQQRNGRKKKVVGVAKKVSVIAKRSRKGKYTASK